MKSLELREKQAEKEEKQKTKKIETSAEKLRKLLKEEKRLKKKRRKSSSSSASSGDESISSSSSTSSSDHKRHKKHRSRSDSTRSSKKRSAKAFSNQLDQDRKDDSFPVPANTSASFLTQKHEVEKLLEKQDRLPYQKKQVKEKDRCSLSSSSVEIPDDTGGRSEDPRDFYDSYKSQAENSKSEKSHKAERHFSYRRDSSDSCYRNSEEKVKIYGYKRFEKDSEGRKEHYKRWEPGSVRYSSTPASSDYPWKSVEKYKKSNYPGSRDFSRHEQRYQLSKNQGEYEKEDNYEEDIKTELSEVNSKEQSESGIKKNLPQNLLNIFNQIAAFEREKGNKPKN